MYRIGYACKFKHSDQRLNKKELTVLERMYNTRTTTAKWCRDNPTLFADRLHEIVTHNIQSIMYQLSYVSSLPKNQRMLRIGSDILPLYTHRDFSFFYDDQTLRDNISKSLYRCGVFARENDIRISFHPGQFTVLASENPNVVTNSIEEFEYHVYLLMSMGYCKNFQDAKCNVHVGGKLGVNGIKQVMSRLSPEARNVITIENDEISYGLDEIMDLIPVVPIVLDIHHHFIKTGEYISCNDDRVKRVIDSWKGVRPTMHYSLSREDVLVNHDNNVSPDLTKLLASGYTKQKLRAHSEMMWNVSCNKWASTFLSEFDIMIEAKQKNLASTAFYEEIKNYL